MELQRVVQGHWAGQIEGSGYSWVNTSYNMTVYDSSDFTTIQRLVDANGAKLIKHIRDDVDLAQRQYVLALAAHKKELSVISRLPWWKRIFTHLPHPPNAPNVDTSLTTATLRLNTILHQHSDYSDLFRYEDRLGLIAILLSMSR